MRSGALICYHRRPISLLVPPKQKTWLRPCTYGILNIHYLGTRRVVKNYPGNLLPGYPTGTRGSPNADNTTAIMAIMSDGHDNKNELCLQFCLDHFLSLSDMRGHCQSQIQLLAFFDSRNTPTTFNASRRGLFLSPVNLLRLLLYSVRETRNCCIIETTITNTVDINNTNDVAFDVMMIWSA